MPFQKTDFSKLNMGLWNGLLAGTLEIDGPGKVVIRDGQNQP